MSVPLALLLAVLLLAANALFVGAEFALISARRSAVEPLAAAGSRRAKITLRAMENVSIMLAGAQLGITVCSLGLGAVAEPAVARLIDAPLEAVGVSEGLVHPISFVIALSVVVFLHVVIGEMVPKNIALAGPERSAVLLGPVLAGAVQIVRPVLVGLNKLANVTLRLVRVEPKDEVTSAFTRDEVAGLVAESRREGLLDDEEHELLTGALDFEERKARDVVVPLAEMRTVPEGVTAGELEAAVVETGFSRFPVRSASGDLTGYLHLKDVLDVAPHRRDEPVAAKWVRPLARVGIDDGLRAVTRTMQSTGAHLARVTDHLGNVLGVVALEDVLEELIGEIRDDTAASRRPPRPRS